MQLVTTLEAYEDERGNRIEYDGRLEKVVRVKFVGENNTLRVAADARLGAVVIDFDCNHGLVEIGPSRGVPAFLASIRVGEKCRILVGRNVSTTTKVTISAAEGASVVIGDDCMLAANIQIRADDGHPIFDVRSGRRVNMPRDIVIGNHVWLGYEACVLGGSTIGDGTVVGMRSIVSGRLPNNVIAVGMPARVVKRDIAWERPHLTMARPFVKPDASFVTKSEFWSMTAEPKHRRASRSREIYAGARRRTRKGLKAVRARARTLSSRV
jgi:acetyltransferase-like isoleucine patch superfamily enzyme